MSGDLRTLPPSARLELLALRVGLKPAVRLRLPRKAAERLAREQGLGLAELPLAESEGWWAGGEHFLRLSRRGATKHDGGIFYLASTWSTAEHLARAEAEEPHAPAVGERLGYPRCCSAAYQRIDAASDWLDAMLDATEGDLGLAACNRVARQLGATPLLPDYFPCSFCCRASAAWAEDLDAARRAEGFNDEAVRAWHDHLAPLRIDPQAVVRLDGSWLRRNGRPRPVRYLTWTRGACA